MSDSKNKQVLTSPCPLVWSQMQENFSQSSVSCLMNTNLRSGHEDSTAEEKKSDPCWQVTKQLHYHIQKVSIHFVLICSRIDLLLLTVDVVTFF